MMELRTRVSLSLCLTLCTSINFLSKIINCHAAHTQSQPHVLLIFQLPDLPEGEKKLILEQLENRERERVGLEEKLELQDYQEAVDSAEVRQLYSTEVN